MYLLSQVHIYPDNCELRKVMANFVMQQQQNKTINTGSLRRWNEPKHRAAVSRVAESTIVLELKMSNDFAKQQQRIVEFTSEQGARALAMASEAMRIVDAKRSLKLAQRAVHINPVCREAWAALLQCSK